MPAHLGMSPSLLGGRPALAYVPGGSASRIRLGPGASGPARRPHPPSAGGADDAYTFPAGSSGEFSGDDAPKRRTRRPLKEPRSRQPPRRAAASYDSDSEDPEAAAAAAARAASAMFDNMDDAAKQDLWVRLCENDVEYNEMKNMCKANDLGGKDMKYKLRAKLIKQVGEQLGKRRWTRESYGADFKAPTKMTMTELSAFFEEREIVMPEDRDEAVGFAYAIMVQDGVIDAAAVPSPSDYDNKNVEELKGICKARGLPQTGNKAEMMSRLIAHDQEVARQKRQIVARAAATLECRIASVDAPPCPPNGELADKLNRAVVTASEIGGMTLPELRTCAYDRGLPVYGTVEALQDRIMEVLRREAVEAHAGRDRLLRYAEAAVGKLSEEEVLEALALRGMGRKSLGGAEEEAVRLINTLVDEWIHNALHPLPAEETSDVEEGEEAGDDGFGADAADEGYGEETAAGVQGEDDPTLDVVLLCTGATPAAREAGLAAARALVPLLQSDVLWGTINPAVEQEVPYIDDEARAAAAAGQLSPPADAIEIFTLAPLAHGVMMHLNCPLVTPDTLLVVTAAPIDDPSLRTVVKECRPADSVVLQGLAPDTMYEFSVRLRNAAGDGPVSEQGTFETATPPRHGVAAWVALSLPPASDDAMFGNGSEEARYVMLTWEELHGSTLAEIDAKLRAGGGAAARPLRDLLPAGAVVLPLGPPSAADGADGPVDAAFVGSWGSAEARHLAASRPKFSAAARNLGYDAVSLLELTAADLDDDLSAAESKLNAWLEAQGADPVASRVAVRLEAPGGDVVGVGVGRGPAEILGGAAELLEAHAAPSAVLEVIQPGSVFFSVAVVEGPEGAAVALPPTEIGYEDIEEDFFAAELELRSFEAVTGGDAAARVAALVEFEKEGRRLPPGAVGSLVLPTQRAVHATPPASLPPGVSESVRLAAAKLFKDLNLRDFARFSGWVLPEDPMTAAGLAPAAEILRSEAAAAANGAGTAAEEPPRPAPKPFSALQALHEQEQARLADEARAASSPHDLKSSASVSQKDRDVAVDVQDYAYAVDEEEPEAALANLPVLREAGEGVEAPVTRYGTYNGIALDDRTRADMLVANPPPPTAPVPEGLPEVAVPTALPDLAGVTPAELCRIGGRRIAFSAVDVSLGEVGDRLGPLAAAAAAAGTSVSSLARRLVAAAAARAGLPPLAPRPVTPPPDFFIDQDDSKLAAAANLDLATDGAEEGVVSLDDIGADLDAWEWERERPLEGFDAGIDGNGGDIYDPTLESYDAIRLAAEAEAAAAAAEAVMSADAGDAAALAGLPGGADAFGLGSDPSDSALTADETPGMDLRRDFPGLHPTRQRVWVLCGGEGPQRDASLAAAAHAAAVLQNEQDLLIETFFLDPYDAGVREQGRRRTLLARRLDLQKMGADDDAILEHSPEYHPSRIRAPAPPPADALDWRGVWRLGSTPLVRPNVPDLAEGCERALTAGTTVYLERSEGDEVHRRDELVAAAREELRLAGLEPGGPAPWGGYLDRGELPQYSFLKDWVAAAQEQCVVVLLALPGHPVASGPLQRLLESRTVPFTGAASVGVELCADRPELLRLLGSEPPYHTLALPELNAQCDSQATADDFHARLFGGWEGKILSIRPAHACGGLGVARVASGRDLQVYCAAVREWAPTIPAGMLEGEDGDVAMPVPPPTQFVIEPASHGVWLTLPAEREPPAAAAGSGAAAAPAAADPLAARLTWPPKDPKDRWLEVKACLLGATGSMRALSLTATVIRTRRDPATGADAVVDSFELTPIPPSILAPDKALEARLRLQQVADTTGLSGAAQITALVDTCSGEVCEVIVREVDPHPDLSPEGLLMRQAAAAPIPMSPVDVFRELLKVGMSREGGGVGYNGDLGWLDGGELYDLSSAMGAGDILGGRGGGGAAANRTGRGYWGLADVEIDPDLLGLSEEEIEREIKRQAKKEREKREDEEWRRAADAEAALDDDSPLA